MLTAKERQDLVCQNMGIADAAAAAKKKSLSHVTFEELRSAACLGLVEAAARFDPACGEFARYARVRAAGAVRDYLRSLGWGSRGDVSRGVLKFQSLEVTAAPASGRDPAAVFEEVARNLPPRCREVCRLYFLEGVDRKGIADRIGVSESRVSQLISSSRLIMSAA